MMRSTSQVPMISLCVVLAIGCGGSEDEHARLAHIEAGPFGALKAVRQARERLEEQEAHRATVTAQECLRHKHDEYQQGMTRLLSDIATHLDMPQDPTCQRSALVDAVARVAAATEPVLALIITDGVDTTYAASHRVPVPAPGEGVIATMVVLPAHGEDHHGHGQWQAFEHVKAYWTARAPWLHVTPAFSRRLPTGTDSHIDRLEIFDDRTISVDSQARAAFHHELLAMLPTLIDAHHFHEIAVCPFGDDSWQVTCHGPFVVPRLDDSRCRPHDSLALLLAPTARDQSHPHRSE